jgi:Type IV secretion-system coupling protein DNA-binding domain
MPTLTNSNRALAVAVRPDPLLLERALVKRAAGLVIDSNGNGNGHGNGNGNGNGDGGNGHADTLSASSQQQAPTVNEPAPSGNNQFDFAPIQKAQTAGSESFQPPTASPPAAGSGLNPEPPPSSSREPAPVQAQTAAEGPAVSVTAGSATAPQNQWSEPANVVMSKPEAGPTADFFAAAPATTPMDEGPVEPVTRATGTAGNTGPDFFDSPVARQFGQPQAIRSPMSNVQRASGAHGRLETTIAATRYQQSISGAQPPPMSTSGQHAALANRQPSPPPPGSANDHVERASEATQQAAPDAVPERQDAGFEPAPQPAAMDFFAQTSFDAAPAASKERAKAKPAREEELLPFEEPTKRKSSRSRRTEAEDDDDEDEEEEKRPTKKSVMKSFEFDDEPPAVKPSDKSKTAKRKRRDDDDSGRKSRDDAEDEAHEKDAEPDEHDEDHDEDEDSKQPHRRSFSGNPKQAKKVSDGNKRRRKLDRDPYHGEDADEDESEEGSGTPVQRFLQSRVTIAGMNITRQTQLMIIGCTLIAVPIIFQIFGMVYSGISSLMPQEKLPLMTGDWKMQVTENGRNFFSLLRLQQVNPSSFVGEGKDSAPFYVVGSIGTPDQIAFNKYYRQADGTHGKPVVYRGAFDLTRETPVARGDWMLSWREGAFVKAKMKTRTGFWIAEQSHVATHVNILPPDADMAAPPLDKNSKPPEFWQTCFHVAGILLLCSVGLVFFVWKSFGTNGLMSIRGKRQYVPSQYRGEHNKILGQLSKPIRAGSMPLGQRCEWQPFLPWEKKFLALPPEVRDKDPHMLVIGAGDKGKTRLIASMIVHDIESNDRAVVVIDSDGDLVDMITRWISHHHQGKAFAKRTVLLDPTSKNGSLGYNPLAMPEDGDLQAAASSIVYGFKAIYTEPPGAQSQWNAQTANILRNAALLLMANGKTLIDLPSLLQDNDFRDILLEAIEKKKKEKVEYTTLLDTWGQYKKLARTDQWINWVEPILNRVGPMLSDPRIRPILTDAEGQIKLQTIIQEKQILLVKITKGQLDQNANLLGSLVITGLKQAAMALSAARKEKPCSLYLDEFDNFIEKETLEAITSETEKYRIGFVGAVKTLQHLPEDFRNQLIINMGTMCCFALSKKDGDLLGPQMFRVDGRKIKHQTMSNFFNPVNTSPQFELISDEEKLNIDRVVGQDARSFFCYRVGSQAGVFHMKSTDFKDISDRDVNWKLIEKMHAGPKKAADKDD